MQKNEYTLILNHFIMSTTAITPEEAWNQLSSFWSSFPFLLEEGATFEEITSFENEQDVVLQDNVKELINIHSMVRVPTGIYGYFCAETAMSTLDEWVRFDNSILNTQMDDPDFWPGIFKDYNCPSTSMEDYVVIGSDPWGADYGIYMMLHQSSSTVYGINWNIPEITHLGDMITWLAEHRLGDYKNEKEYVDNWNENDDNSGGTGISKTNRFYLNIGYPEALKAWDTKEDEFIKAFDSIS